MSKQVNDQERAEGLSRRGFITGAAVSAVALTTLVKNEAKAQSAAPAAGAPASAEAAPKK